MNTTTETRTLYYIWDVRNAEIFDHQGFETIREVIEYGNSRLPHFWMDDNNLYKIREL